MKLPLRCLEAIDQAEEVRQKFGITSLPVDPFQIAEKCDITVMPKSTSSPGVSGFLVKSGDDFGIMYATHIENKGFMRFTVAHELGHYFLPGHPQALFPQGDGRHESRAGFASKNPYEEEADHFATALLMPTELFQSALQSAGTGFPAVEKLAADCITSITSTAIRFATLSADPVAVIVSRGTTIDYCFTSNPVRDLPGIRWIRKGERIPPGTETLKFNGTPQNITAGARAEGLSNLEAWFDGAPDLEMKEDVVGLGSYGKTLTVLFTEQALPDEEDLEESDEDD